jgi:hypothetical protein
MVNNGFELGDTINFTDADGKLFTVHVSDSGETVSSSGGVVTRTHTIGGSEVGGPDDGRRGRWPLDQIADITIIETADQYRVRWEREVVAAEALADSTAGPSWPYGLTLETRPWGRDRIEWIAVGAGGVRRSIRAGDIGDDQPAVSIYDRAAYERVCAALGIEARLDAHPMFGFDHAPTCDRDSYHPVGVYLTFEMAARRWAGIQIERQADTARRRDELDAAGLGDGPLDRAQYEQASRIMGTAPLPDRHCLIVDNEQAARRVGAGFTTLASLPHTGPAVDLAVRRAQHVEAAAASQPVPTQVCDECGVRFPAGTGMVASLGLAHDVDCFDAMADRRGRYATTGRRV